MEHLVILGIVLLLFGPRRLPELGNTMGKAIRNFKDALSGVEEAKFRRLEEEAKASAVPPVASSGVAPTEALATPVVEPLKTAQATTTSHSTLSS